jgi:hypothetical protein
MCKPPAVVLVRAKNGFEHETRKRYVTVLEIDLPICRSPCQVDDEM